jgi:hypothetical protein
MKIIKEYWLALIGFVFMAAGGAWFILTRNFRAYYLVGIGVLVIVLYYILHPTKQKSQEEGKCQK